MQWGYIYLIWCIQICYYAMVGGEYIGCYVEASDLYEYVGIRAMDACRTACYATDKTYYVVKRRGNSWKIDCHCVDILPGESTDSQGCDRVCGGECGGVNSRSIYSVCDRGHWGWSCNERCYCEDNFCQPSSGHCSGMCKTGYWGQSCDSLCHCTVPCEQILGLCGSACIVGYWGGTCSSTCKCFNNDPCNKENGNCPNGCVEGWTGSACNDCETGRWGETCSELCHCKDGAACQRASGFCDNGCEAGWMGDTCSTRGCQVGRWGDICDNECHCKDGQPCLMESGQCSGGCAPGWTGSTCDTEDDKCDPGFWGLACNNTCHCKNNADCMRSNGLCPNGCEPGKYGPSCDKVILYEDIGCFSSDLLQDSIADDIQDSSDLKEDCRQMCISHKSGYFTVVTDTDIMRSVIASRTHLTSIVTGERELQDLSLVFTRRFILMTI